MSGDRPLRIAIIGGYGNAGRAVAGLLAVHTSAEIVLLGRDGDRARRAAAELATATGAPVTAGAVDVAAGAGLLEAVRDADLVLVASSTTSHTAHVAATILEAGSDYFDLNLSSPAKIAALRALEDRLVAQGRCFITDGGVHPGVPGALVRWAASRARLRSAAVAARFDIDWKSLRLSKATQREFVLELMDFDPTVLQGGRWRRGTRFSRSFDLGPPFGKTGCVPMCMEEIRELPEAIPGLRDAGFWVAGFGAVVDLAIMPVAFTMARVSRALARPASRLLTWGLRSFGSGSGGVVVLLEAETEDGARTRLRLAHPDAYVITAAPVVAAILQYIDGKRPPGLWTQASYVEPVRFLKDMERLGIEVSEEQS